MILFFLYCGVHIFYFSNALNLYLYLRYKKFYLKYVIAQKLILIMYANKPLEALGFLSTKNNNMEYFYYSDMENVNKFFLAYFPIGFYLILVYEFAVEFL